MHQLSNRRFCLSVDTLFLVSHQERSSIPPHARLQPSTMRRDSINRAWITLVRAARRLETDSFKEHDHEQVRPTQPPPGQYPDS